MNKSLMTIVLESAAFFELAEDELIDPDSAIEQMEGMISVLDDLTPSEKTELNRFAIEYADTEESKGGPAERVTFFRSFAEHFGLVE
jgi:hypothetical protein